MNWWSLLDFAIPRKKVYLEKSSPETWTTITNRMATAARAVILTQVRILSISSEEIFSITSNKVVKKVKNKCNLRYLDDSLYTISFLCDKNWVDYWYLITRTFWTFWRQFQDCNEIRHGDHSSLHSQCVRAQKIIINQHLDQFQKNSFSHFRLF